MEVEDEVLDGRKSRVLLLAAPPSRQSLPASPHFPMRLKAHVGSSGDPLGSERWEG